MTALELYRQLLDLLRESGLSKQEKIEILERASSFVKRRCRRQGNLGTESAEE
jgi:hypothetical protein